VTGNPIRDDILAIPPPAFDQNMQTVLIFGGSQGAKRLNEAVLAALPTLTSRRDHIRFIHQTGTEMELAVRKKYREAGFEAEVHAFIDPMAQAYRRSDVIIARSGSSVLEIAACGRPSILVPYPYAADDHQRANARVLEKGGAALYLEEAECTGPRLGEILSQLLGDLERLKKMSLAALHFRKEDPAKAIAQELRKLAGEAAA
jgi:UDP-N-acetylglucosamine--N-acetylmuramyl-(pentapeptide) pyrophosphoryl-undecaprenol N-acetylglucosamine transferase